MEYGKMFRPEIKVVDCTIRDGGLTNNSHFTTETVRGVYAAACASGVDYVELGYRNCKKMLSPDEFGAWRFCDESDLRAATDGIDPRGTKMAVMMDAHKSNLDDVGPCDESVLDMIRVATYVKDIDKAIRLANCVTGQGYEGAMNIMAISQEGSPFLDEALQQIEEETDVKVVYIVDSYGALYCEEVDFLVDKYKKHLKTKEVGVHMHNNQQLAFSNTIEGIIKNANYVDGTLYGMGRGAGNCPTELLMGFLKNPKFDMVPVLDAIEKFILPLRKDIPWGYHVPYMLTGIRDLHPREAIKWMYGERPNDIVDFYKKLEVEYE